MNVVCPGCSTIYRVDPAKITSVNLKARCSVCSGVIPVGERARWEMELVAAGAPKPQPRDAAASPDSSARASVSDPVRERQSPAARPAVTPSRWAEAITEESAPLETSPAASVAGAAAPSVASAAAANASSARAVPAPDERLGSGPERPASSASQSTSAPARPSMPPLASAFTTPSTPAQPVSQVGVRRPINPFLANDPHQRARRLARALVSDMVAYHPSRREEGLREGTLKELFAEEIKKSYEEYVEQVGREFAESTTYFRDALNEVLAGGRMIF